MHLIAKRLKDDSAAKWWWQRGWRQPRQRWWRSVSGQFRIVLWSHGHNSNHGLNDKRGWHSDSAMWKKKPLHNRFSFENWLVRRWKLMSGRSIFTLLNSRSCILFVVWVSRVTHTHTWKHARGSFYFVIISVVAAFAVILLEINHSQRDRSSQRLSSLYATSRHNRSALFIWLSRKR